METTECAAPVRADLRAFIDAPAWTVPAQFRRLDHTFRAPAQGSDSTGATAEGRAAVHELAAALPDAPPDRRPHLVLLLALLADTDAHDGVRLQLKPVLQVFADAVADRRLVAALLYFCSLFPEERDAVVAAASAVQLSPDDRSRLERSLITERPQTPALARAWPSPAMWAVTEAELEADRQNWIKFMPEPEIVRLWDGDTRKLRDYTLLKAVALLDTEPEPYSAEPDHAEPDRADSDRADSHQADSHQGDSDQAEGTAAPAIRRLAPFEELLACPDCFQSLHLNGEGARCQSCGTAYPASTDWLDLSSSAGQGVEAMILNDPGQVSRYERGLRPAFLRVMGQDFTGLLSVGDEVDFLARHLREIHGPAVDLAAGSGRFTRILADLLPDPSELIALDLSTSMLTALQATSPKLPAIRGSAVNLPFRDGSLGAVTCWNALQTLPDQGRVIAEVGRCLADGGIFTLFTYEPAADPLYRKAQLRHEQDLRVQLHPRQTVLSWLEEAGFQVIEEYRPGGYLLLAAVRQPRS